MIGYGLQPGTGVQPYHWQVKKFKMAKGMVENSVPALHGR